MYRIVVLYKILWLLFVHRSPRLQSCSYQFCCCFWYYSIHWFLRTHTPARFSLMFPANRSIASYHHCTSCRIDQGVAVLPSSSTTAFLTSIPLLPFSNNRQHVLVSSLLDIFLVATILVRFFDKRMSVVVVLRIAQQLDSPWYRLSWDNVLRCFLVVSSNEQLNCCHPVTFLRALKGAIVIRTCGSFCTQHCCSGSGYTIVSAFFGSQQCWLVLLLVTSWSLAQLFGCFDMIPFFWDDDLGCSLIVWSDVGLNCCHPVTFLRVSWGLSQLQLLESFVLLAVALSSSSLPSSPSPGKIGWYLWGGLVHKNHDFVWCDTFLFRDNVLDCSLVAFCVMCVWIFAIQ